MTPLPFFERCKAYQNIIESFLERLQKTAVTVHVPRLGKLRAPHPEMLFHLTPELFLQMGGYTEFVCPVDRFDLRVHEVALVPRRVPHGERARNQRNSKFRGLVFCFNVQAGASSELSLHLTKSSPDSRPAVEFSDRFESPDVSQAIRYIDEAAAASLRATATAEARRRSLLVACLSVIHDLLTDERLADRGQPSRNPKVARCRELIQVYLPDPALSVASLARELGCTVDHLSRCFREEIGAPVLSCIRQQRIARAKDLMQDPKVNISEIAWACGFNSLNYFVRAFRQAVGMPPSRYRKHLLDRVLEIER